jgi:osmotically-inducible protein OsmY
MPDVALQAAIMEALAENRLVHPDEIAVDVRGGDAVLRGTVGTLVQREEAERAVRRVRGVQRVENELEVRPVGIDGRVDADTKAAVLHALIADDQIHAGDVDVDMHDGTATLTGMVELVSQRDRAQRMVLRVPGVAHVRNELRVWVAVSADDVAERVTDAIGANAVVGADAITVTVSDNDVTLAGVVGSRGHRDAAVAAAAGAPGVARVNDKLTLRSPRNG